MPRLQSSSTPGQIPLVLGVTGHRNIDPADRGTLEERVREIIRDLRATYPNTPLVLLSPLADGADRLVARVCVELGLGFQVPLPMPRDVYATDFDDEPARAEFDALLRQADHWFELPLADGVTLDDISHHGPARVAQYDRVGEFIARHAELLIALWDGRTTGKVGGTAEIVKWRLSTLPRETTSELQPPDPVRSGPVIQIVTPRENQPRPADALAVHWHYPPGLQGESVPGATYQAVYRDLDRFNAQVLAVDPEAVAKSAEYLLPSSEAERLPIALRQTRTAFATADALAIANQRSRVRVRLAVFETVIVAIFFYQIFDDLFFLPGHAVLTYPVVLGIAYLISQWAKRRDFENKYQDYRGLAEGLRVQFFWRLAGLTDSAEAHYLRRQRSEMNWVRKAIRVVWGLQGGRYPEILSPDERRCRTDLAVKHWVEDQAKFFHRGSSRAEHKVHRFERFIGGIMKACMAWSLLMGLAIVLPLPWHEELHHWMKHTWWADGFVLLSVGLPLTAAAMVHSYREGLELGAHAKQYEALARLFDTARDQLQRTDGAAPTDVPALLAELGREALIENGDWVLMHRERPLALPHGH